MNIGLRPTFGGQTRTLEVHLLDWSDHLVGRRLAVEFVAWLRPELRFDSAEALIAAMRDDVATARRLLEAASGSAAVSDEPAGRGPKPLGSRRGGC